MHPVDPTRRPRPSLRRALRRAWRHTRPLLERPVAWRLLLLAGVLAFFDGLAQGSAGFTYDFEMTDVGLTSRVLDVTPDIQEMYSLLFPASGIDILLNAPVLLLAFGAGVLAIYLGSVGQVLLVYIVATGDRSVVRGWRATTAAVTSLFLLRLLLAVAAFAALTIGLLLAVWMLLGAGTTWARAWPAYVLLAVIGGAFVAANFALRNFIVPVMLARDVPCYEACVDFWRAARGRWRGLLGYVGLRLVLALPFTLLSVVVGVATCGLGFLPVAHHVLLSPVYVFERALSMHIVAMLDDAFDAFSALGGEDEDAAAAPQPGRVSSA